jgi:hypothetical protein
LKLCFIGYAFAGKKLQALKIKQEFGLDSLTMSDLVDEALEFFKANPNPIVKESPLEDSPIKESLHEESKDEIDPKDVPNIDEQEIAQPTEEIDEEKKADDGEAQDAAPSEEQATLRQNPIFKRR